jgi:hypothetical protein
MEEALRFALFKVAPIGVLIFGALVAVVQYRGKAFGITRSYMLGMVAWACISIVVIFGPWKGIAAVVCYVAATIWMLIAMRRQARAWSAARQ